MKNLVTVVGVHTHTSGLVNKIINKSNKIRDGNIMFVKVDTS